MRRGFEAGLVVVWSSGYYAVFVFISSTKEQIVSYVQQFEGSVYNWNQSFKLL
jgi:hypothetical protein